MASFDCIGFVSLVKFTPESVILLLDEFQSGYKRKDGTIVGDRYYTYKTIWQPYYRKFISDHFGKGTLVHVKGSMLPYSIERGNQVNGYTILGEHITMASYPRQSAKMEMKMIRESQEASEEAPDLEAFRQADF